MSRVKVLYVLTQLGMGGTERQTLHLIQGLDRARFEPEVATLASGGTLLREFEAACPVHVFDKRPATELSVLLSLRALIRRLRPQIVHACSFPANWRGVLAAKTAGTAVVLASVRNMGDWMGPIRRRVEKAVVSRADAVLVNAGAIARYMVEKIGVRADRLRVIPNGVDTDRFRPWREGDPDLRASLLQGGATIAVGTVMSLTSKKNPFLLLDAASRVLAEVPAARFLLAGEGPLEEEVRSRIARGGFHERFHFLGLRRDVPDLLRSLDLLVLPSDREGLPNIVLEAMATALPVVATAVGGTTDLVHEGVTGRLAPPRDPAALAQAILSLLRDPASARRMGEEALRRARAEYALEAMIDRTQALYGELLARVGPVGAGEAPGRGGLAAEGP
jgi:glycosyltransferase involved in cell wall biosynthesis